VPVIFDDYLQPWVEWSTVATFVVTLIAAVIGVSGYLKYRFGLRKKSKRLEEYLRNELAEHKDKGQRSIIQIMKDVGLTEDEIIQISFSNPLVRRRAVMDDNGLAKQLLFEYNENADLTDSFDGRAQNTLRRHDPMNASSLAAWRRIAVRSFSAGLGAAIGIGLVVGGTFLYKSRHEQPKPWGDAPIIATFDSADVEGANDLVFTYILENPTDYDCRISEGPTVKLFSRLKSQNSLSPYNYERLQTKFPIFIPAKERVLVRINVEFGYHGPLKPDSVASAQEAEKWKSTLYGYLNQKIGNLDGFFILAEDRRCRVVLPKGW
jgi:hypothetical protein